MATRKKKRGGRASPAQRPVSIRPYLPRDANRVVLLAEEIRKLDPGAPHLDAPRWRFVCADPWADSEGHFHVAETDDGSLVGFSYRFDPPRLGGGTYRAVYVVVHPDYRRRGVGRSLMEATLEKMVPASVDPGWFAATTVDAASDSGLAFARKMGFRKAFTRLVLRRELPGRPLPRPDLPELTIERFVGARAYRDWARLHNEAYTGQDDAIHHDPDELEDHKPDGFRPDHVRFAKIAKERVGYLFLRETTEGGHIESIGVLPEHRGKGIGTALTAAALEYFIERGHGQVTLVVDVRNAAALKVYARLDFEEIGRRHTLVKRQRSRRR